MEVAEKMRQWLVIAYLAFVAAVVVWLLLAISYGLAPHCAVGSEWTRASCFFLPMWRFFA